MDGVLVDFAGYTVKLVNDLLDGRDIPWGAEKSGGYHKRIGKIPNSLGKGWRASKPEDLDHPDVRSFMFNVIGTNPGAFYSALDPLDDGIGQLWQELKATGREVYILSAGVPPGGNETTTSEQGKKDWVAKNGLDPVETIVVQGDRKVKTPQKKAVYANTNGIQNILIDDSEKNTKAWRDAGGFAIDHIPRGSEATKQELKKLFNETPI